MLTSRSAEAVDCDRSPEAADCEGEPFLSRENLPDLTIRSKIPRIFPIISVKGNLLMIMFSPNDRFGENLRIFISGERSSAFVFEYLPNTRRTVNGKLTIRS